MVATSKIEAENKSFTPPSDKTVWLSEMWRPLTERKVSTGMVEARGHAVYSVNIVTGEGTTEVETLAAAIAETFEPGTSIQHSGNNVAIDRSERGPGFVYMDLWYRVPVIVLWRTYAATSTP